MRSKYKIETRDKNKTVNTEKQTDFVEEMIANFNAAAFSRQEQGIDDMIATNNDYYENNVNTDPEYEGDPCSRTNIIKSLIESAVADFVESPHDLTAEAYEPTDYGYAADFENFMEYIYNENNPEIQLDMFERWRRKYGTGIFMTDIDPDGLNGFGLPRFKAIHPENFFPDPKVTRYDELEKADFIFLAGFESLRWVKQTFGDRAKYVTADTSLAFNLVVTSELESMGIDSSVGESVFLLRGWYKNDKGELHLAIIADSELLYCSDPEYEVEDEEENYFEYLYIKNEYPFIVVPLYLVDGRLWGKSDIDDLIPIQDAINDFDDQITLNARLTGNNQMVVGKRARIDLKKWPAVPGLKIPATDEKAIHQIQPQSIPYYIIDHRNKKFDESELLTGRTDVVEGRNAPGVRTSSGILALQESAKRRINHSNKMAQVGMSSVVSKLADYALDYYDEYIPVKRKKGKSDINSFTWVNPAEWKDVPIKVPDPQSRTTDGDYTLKDLIGDDGKVQTRELKLKVQFKFHMGVQNNSSFMYQAALDMHRENVITTDEARLIIKQVLDFPIIDPLTPVGEFLDQTNSKIRLKEQLETMNLQNQLGQSQMQNQQMQQQQSVIANRGGQMDNTNPQLMGAGSVDPGTLNAMTALLGGKDR